jgi:hypothetical protein
VLLLLHAVVPFSFISRHSCLLKFKSLCRLEQQPWSSCSLSLRSRPTYHGPCQAQSLYLSYSGHCRPRAIILTLFSSSPPWCSSPLILLSSIFVRFPCGLSSLRDLDPSQPSYLPTLVWPPERLSACWDSCSRSSRARAPSPSNDQVPILFLLEVMPEKLI